jgi:hypothetical protein
VIRRVLDTTLKSFVDDGIAAVLSADFQLGVKSSDLHRISNVIPYTRKSPTSASPVPDSPAGKQANNPPFNPDMANNSLRRDSEFGAGNGHSNARGLVRIRLILLGARNRKSHDTSQMRTGHTGLCNKHQATNNQLCIYDCILQRKNQMFIFPAHLDFASSRPFMLL